MSDELETAQKLLAQAKLYIEQTASDDPGLAELRAMILLGLVEYYGEQEGGK